MADRVCIHNMHILYSQLGSTAPFDSSFEWQVDIPRLGNEGKISPFSYDYLPPLPWNTLLFHCEKTDSLNQDESQVWQICCSLTRNLLGGQCGSKLEDLDLALQAVAGWRRPSQPKMNPMKTKVHSGPRIRDLTPNLWCAIDTSIGG